MKYEREVGTESIWTQTQNQNNRYNAKATRREAWATSDGRLLLWEVVKACEDSEAVVRQMIVRGISVLWRRLKIWRAMRLTKRRLEMIIKTMEGDQREEEEPTRRSKV